MKNGHRNDKYYVTESKDNESSKKSNNINKELGNFHDVMIWLAVHDDTQHPHA
jgi:hypothetical protein